MTTLINLLPWLPGFSGFGSYVQRVLPGLQGVGLQLDSQGEPRLTSGDQLGAVQPDGQARATGGCCSGTACFSMVWILMLFWLRTILSLIRFSPSIHHFLMPCSVIPISRN